MHLMISLVSFDCSIKTFLLQFELTELTCPLRIDLIKQQIEIAAQYDNEMSSDCQLKLDDGQYRLNDARNIG